MNSESGNGKIWLVLVILIIIIPAAIWYVQEKDSPSETLNNPHIETTIASPRIRANKVALKQLDITALDQKIDKVIAEQTPEGNNWMFGVAITDPLTNQKYGKNETEVFDAASTGKIPILASLYDQIKSKKINEEETITITSADVQDYGTGSIRYQKMPKTYTVKELAELMIKQSDNTAAYVLATKAGRKNIAQYVKDLGMDTTDTAENTTTPYDINLMLEHIFKMKETDPTTAGTLVKMMTDSIFENRLPALLPEETIVAHKIGTGTAQIHDVGIVLLDKRPYIISVFTKRVNDEKTAEKTIAEISKEVYEEFRALEQ